MSTKACGLEPALRIGIVCPYDMFRGGGVQEFVRALQNGLHERGHKVTIITPRPRHYTGPVPRGYKLVGTSARFNTPLQTLVDVTVSIDGDELADYLRDQKFDLLHFQEPWVPDLGRQVLGRSDCINLATFHAALPPTAMSRSIERVAVPYTRSAFKYLHQLVAVSDPAAAYVRSLTDAPIKLIPNGIDLAKYKVTDSKSVPNEGQKSVLYVGRLEKRKGVRYLIEAAALLKQWHSDFKLVIAGDGALRQNLEELAGQLEVPVDFLGYVSEEQKLALLRDADLFVAPAIHGESFGIVLLEAMATGTPLIAGDNPGYRSVLQSTGALSLINPKHSVDFARRMELLLYSTSVRQVWLDWSNEYVQQFDYRHIISSYESLYRQLVATQPPPIQES